MKTLPINHVKILIGKAKKELEYHISARHMKSLKILLEDMNIATSQNDSKSHPASDVLSNLWDQYTRIGSNLKGARYKNGFTQEELANKLKITQGDLSKMENGKRTIGVKMAKRLANILNVDCRLFLKDSTEFSIKGG